METTDSAADVQAPVAVFKKRGAKGKANLRKRAATPPPVNSDSDSEYSSEDEAGHRVKRRRKDKAGLISASTKDAAAAKPSAAELGATVFSADRAVPITSTNDATKQSNWYDDEDEDENTVVRSSKSKHSKISDSTVTDGNYKGLANKTTFIQKNPDAPNRSVGPIKAPTNIRTITVTDYAPDVCKDYKKTGFCGFGDNCKYLHSREAYAAGWQLDKEWESVTKGKKNMGGTVVASVDRRGKDEPDGGGALDEADEAMLKEIPFACIICKQPYRDPIVTRCGHYFCEGCALQRYRRDPTCAACGVGTNGVFNGAKRLKKLLERKREREEKRRQAAIEAGEEIPDEEGQNDEKK